MDSSAEPLNIKLVIVGDGSVGKTCILLSYTTDQFPTEYVPTVFENYTTQTVVDKMMVNLSLWDTAGQETYNRLRTLSYAQADIFLIVFSVVEQASFDNVLQKVYHYHMQWFPELSQEELMKIPKIVVGNKIDMRNEENPQHIKYQAAKATLEVQKVKYFECSALTQEGLKLIFEEAIKAAIKNKQNLQSQNPPSINKDAPLLQEKENCCCHIF